MITMNKEECIEKAVFYKRNGFNCTQAVIKALCEYCGKSADELVMATSGFAGGMGCMESTCGALIGANLMAGLITEGKGTLRCAREMVLSFAEKCGATICKDLKGANTGVVLCPCDECVRNGVRVAFEKLGL